MIRSAVHTAVFFVRAPGTMGGLVPWLITAGTGGVEVRRTSPASSR